MRWTDALKVGIAQAFALIPGTSRSGATIIGGMLFGLSRKAATEFSFFLAVPTLVAAGVLLAVEGARRCCRPPTCRCSASASSCRSCPRSLCIRWLIRYVSRNDFVPFAWYRIAFGVVVLVTAWTGVGRVGVTASPSGAQRALDRPAVRDRRHARLLVQGDPDQARLRVASGRRDDAARAAHALLGAVLRRDGVVGGSRRAAPIERARRGCGSSWLGLHRLLPREPARLHRPQLHHRRARAAGALPVPDDGRAAVGACSTGSRSARRAIVALALSYAGIVLVFWHDLRVGGDTPRRSRSAARWCSAARSATRSTSSAPGGVIGRLGSMRFIAWAMLVSTVFVLAHFALTRPLAALDVPPRIHALSLAMAVVLDGAADLARRRGDPAHRREPRRRSSARSGPCSRSGSAR